MLNPTPLLSTMRFRVTGSSEVAGRATVTAHATPRPQDPRHGRSLALHELGTGAHHYKLEVDQERGLLLAVTAIRNEQPFHKITTLAIQFDEPTPAETFQFQPPEGEQSPAQLGSPPPPQHVTLTEAQQLAPFTVLVGKYVQGAAAAGAVDVDVDVDVWSVTTFPSFSSCAMSRRVVRSRCLRSASGLGVGGR